MTLLFINFVGVKGLWGPSGGSRMVTALITAHQKGLAGGPKTPRKPYGTKSPVPWRAVLFYAYRGKNSPKHLVIQPKMPAVGAAKAIFALSSNFNSVIWPVIH